MTRRQRNIEFNGNLFGTSAIGIWKSTSASASVALAGLPRCLDLDVSVQAGGVLYTAASQTAGYRVVWGLRDANNNLILGAPSNRSIFTSTGVNQDANVLIRINPEITTSHFYQVFRTVIGTSADPGDEEAQVYENNPTVAELSAGTITYRDIVPDVYRGDLLYTNNSQEGIENANERPPLARDLVLFRDMIGYANYTDKQRMNVQMIGVTGLINGTSTLTLGGVVYTANAAEVITTGTFLNSAAGTPAQNTDNTAKSLCRVINGYAANTQYYAYYVSTPDTTPGTILLEERGIGGAAFSVIANSAATGNAFAPIIPTSGTTYISAADRRKNRIRWSKQEEVEAVPLFRDSIVGAQDDEIQRVIALTDSCIVIKDKTIWRGTGTTFEDLVFTRLDDMTACAGRDSYVKLNNTIFGLSNQGFIAVGETGVQLVGRPLEMRTFAALAAQDGIPNHDTNVGGSCESQRIYFCRAVDQGSSANITYVYNAITRTWTTWDQAGNCWAVLNDRIYFGRSGVLDAANGYGFSKQRNSLFDAQPPKRDFCDYSFSVTINSIGANNQITIAASDARIVNGCKFYDGANQYVVTNVVTTTVTLNTTTSLTTGAKTFLEPIPVIVEWEPRRAGNPATLKQYGRVKLKCETQDAYALTMQFFTEADTKATPYAQDWNTTAISAATTLYVPAFGGMPATAIANDFGATSGSVQPFNSIPHTVPPERAFGEHISVRVTQTVADSRFAIKALNIETRDTATTRGQQ